MALTAVTSALSMVPYESKCAVSPTAPSSVTIHPQAIIPAPVSALETKDPKDTDYSFPLRKLQLSNTMRPQIMVIDSMRKVFTKPAPLPTDEALVKAQEFWRAKFAKLKKPKLEACHVAKFSELAARYSCIPKSEESGFEEVVKEAKDDQSIFLFSRADWLRICIESTKMKKAGASKILYKFWTLDLHPEKSIQATPCAGTKIHESFIGAQRKWILQNMRAEAAHLARLDHPAICPILSAAMHGENEILSILPYFPRDLRDYFTFDSTPPLAPPPFEPFVQRMLSALVKCHKNETLHLDIKPDNIFCDAGNNAFLGDFGLANICLGAPIFQHIDCIIAANECVALKPYLDVWSMGTVFYLLGLLHKDVMKGIKKQKLEHYFQEPESSTINPGTLLPWGDLSDLRIRIKKLEAFNQPKIAVDQDKETEAGDLAIDIGAAMIAAVDLDHYDCSSWVAYENYDFKKLINLLEIVNRLHVLLDKTEKYKEIMGSNDFIKKNLKHVKKIIVGKLKEMRAALAVAPKKFILNTTKVPFDTWVTYHTLYPGPNSPFTAEYILKSLS